VSAAAVAAINAMQLCTTRRHKQFVCVVSHGCRPSWYSNEAQLSGQALHWLVQLQTIKVRKLPWPLAVVLTVVAINQFIPHMVALE